MDGGADRTARGPRTPPKAANAAPSPAPIARSTCVIWRPRDNPRDGELLAALERRGLRVTIAQSPYEALARLCAGRGNAVGADAPARAADVLVLCDPARLTRIDEVVHMAERYAPSVICWMFDPAGSGHLRAVTREDLRIWESRAPAAHADATPPAAPEPARPASPMAPAPTLRLTGHDTDHREALGATGDADRPSPDQNASVELSDDELRMLLSSSASDSTDIDGAGRV